MTIPFRVKKLTETAKVPTQENPGDLWDLYADNFKSINPDSLTHSSFVYDTEKEAQINPQGRILCKTGIAVELPALYYDDYIDCDGQPKTSWIFKDQLKNHSGVVLNKGIYGYAVADIRPRSGLALKHGITVLNTPGTIDNSYRKEIGVILYNAGHEPYTINKGDKIAQMLIRPLYPSSMEVVEDFEDTGRGGFGSTGK